MNKSIMLRPNLKSGLYAIVFWHIQRVQLTVYLNNYWQNVNASQVVMHSSYAGLQFKNYNYSVVRNNYFNVYIW